MRMATPEMKVVRFNENDIIVASGDALSLSNFHDGNAKTGVVKYNNQTYSLTDSSAVNAVLAALNEAGHDSNTRMSRYESGSSAQKVSEIMNIEVNRGTFLGNWDGNYLFIDGLFRKQ